MSGRRQARRRGGQFTRNTPENTLGMHFNIHELRADGTWCGAFNPSTVGTAVPTHCHACGEPLAGHEHRRPSDV